MSFLGSGRRRLVARFDGGTLTSNAGALLLRAVEACTGVCRRAARCFQDARDPRLIEHSVEELVTQRVMALALGYEDINDHDTLRRDPLVAAVVGKADPTGSSRLRAADRGAALAGKSTLNRLELAKPGKTHRYWKVTYEAAALDALLVDVFIESHPTPPARVVLDVDATDDHCTGSRKGVFFTATTGTTATCRCMSSAAGTCCAPGCGPRTSMAPPGVVDEVARIVDHVRRAWPAVSFLVRGDSGFCRDELLSWCEAHAVDYVVGLAKNERLTKRIAPQQAQAQAHCQATGEAARVFADFRYRTRKSWSRERRVVARPNSCPRAPIRASWSPRCPQTRSRPGRCMKNCIAPAATWRTASRNSSWRCLPTGPAAPRCEPTSCASTGRRWPTSCCTRSAHKGCSTRLARAQCNTLRLRLLKVAAHIRVTTRHIWIALTDYLPDADLFAVAANRLHQARAPA